MKAKNIRVGDKLRDYHCDGTTVYKEGVVVAGTDGAPEFHVPGQWVRVRVTRFPASPDSVGELHNLEVRSTVRLKPRRKATKAKRPRFQLGQKVSVTTNFAESTLGCNNYTQAYCRYLGKIRGKAVVQWGPFKDDGVTEYALVPYADVKAFDWKDE